MRRSERAVVAGGLAEVCCATIPTAMASSSKARSTKAIWRPLRVVTSIMTANSTLKSSLPCGLPEALEVLELAGEDLAAREELAVPEELVVPEELEAPEELAAPEAVEVSLPHAMPMAISSARRSIPIPTIPRRRPTRRNITARSRRPAHRSICSVTERRRRPPAIT